MNHDLPFFSVIVPTYQRPEQLRQCLRSLASLDYPAECFEVIVADDGSETPPEEVVATCSDRIQVRLLIQPDGIAVRRRLETARPLRRAARFWLSRTTTALSMRVGYEHSRHASSKRRTDSWADAL